MQNILKNKLFYLYIGLFCVIYYLLFAGFWFSFGWWFGIWSDEKWKQVSKDYIRTDRVDDVVVRTAMSNISMWEGDYSKFHYFEQALNYIDETKHLINTDMRELLEGRAEKSTVINTHLNEIRMVSQDIDALREDIRSKHSQKMSDSQRCQDQKRQWDNDFYRGLNENQADILMRGLEQSSENAPCYIENRVKANAYDEVLGYLNHYNQILKQKMHLVEDNQHLIIENYQLFEENHLDRLVSLRNNLREFRVN